MTELEQLKAENERLSAELAQERAKAAAALEAARKANKAAQDACCRALEIINLIQGTNR